MSSSDVEIPIFDFDPYGIPRDYLAGLGLISAASAQTEHCLEMAIAAFAKTDLIRGAAICTHMSVPLRHDVLRSLAQLSHLPNEALDALDLVLNRIGNASARRNSYVHNTWGREPATGQVFYVRTTAKDEFSMDRVVVDVDTLYKDAAEIYEAGMALIDFMNEWELSPNDPIIPPNFRERSKKARKRQARSGNQ